MFSANGEREGGKERKVRWALGAVRKDMKEHNCKAGLHIITFKFCSPSPPGGKERKVHGGFRVRGSLDGRRMGNRT